MVTGGLRNRINPLCGYHTVTGFSQSNSGCNHWNHMISYIPPENFMFANDGNPDGHPGPATNVPTPSFSAQDARRLIDHGLRLWDGRPRVREVVWREGRRWYRLRATNFRYLLEWREGRRGWQPGYYAVTHMRNEDARDAGRAARLATGLLPLALTGRLFPLV